MLKHLIPFLLSCVALGYSALIGHERGPAERAAWDKTGAPPLSSWSNRVVNIVTFGHRGLYDDFITIWAVQFLADKDLAKYAGVDRVYASIKSVTRLHPKLESLYVLSCFVLSLDFNHSELCESISRDGLVAFPESWRIPMTQGFIESFKLKNDLQAAVYYGLASSRPSSPPWVADLAKRLAGRGAATGQDMEATLQMLKEIPGGTRVLELLRPKLKNQLPPDLPPPPTDHPANATPGDAPADASPAEKTAPKETTGGKTP